MPELRSSPDTLATEPSLLRSQRSVKEQRAAALKLATYKSCSFPLPVIFRPDPQKLEWRHAMFILTRS